MTVVRLLTFTTLYPNRDDPRRGIFVEQRLQRLVRTGAVSSRVIAPLAWPGRSASGHGAFDLALPMQEDRGGIGVFYPRFPAVPLVGQILNPISMAAASWPVASRSLREQGDVDFVDAQYFFPDAVAGAILARSLNKPLVITARGTDLNHFARRPISRQWIRYAARRAVHIITVSEALKKIVLDLGISERSITVLRNGVDLSCFSPLDKVMAQRTLGWSGPTLLFVGNLVPEKGQDLVIRALAQIKDVQLVMIGRGPDEDRLKRLAMELGIEQRIQWVSHVPQQELSAFYSAADATILASSREGMPNVLLESMACGTPVIATCVGGIPEIVSPDAGVLITERTPESIAAAWRELTARRIDMHGVRRHAMQFDWDEPIAKQLALLQGLLDRSKA